MPEMKNLKTKKYLAGLSVAICLLCSCQNRGERGTRYEIIDLGTLGGAQSQAYGINNSCQVVGNSETGAGNFHAFLWQEGRMRDLGAFPSDFSVAPQTVDANITSGAASVAFSINNNGQIVGMSETGGSGFGGDVYHAVLWSHNKITDLGSNGYWSSVAHSINDNNIIVGVGIEERFEEPPSSEPKISHSFTGTILGIRATPALPDCLSVNVHDFKIACVEASGEKKNLLLWHNKTVKKLGQVMAPFSLSNLKINDKNLVVGTLSEMTGSTVAAEPIHKAFIWRDGKPAILVLPPGFSDSKVSALNNSGQIVGEVLFQGTALTAVLWEQGKVIDLNTVIPKSSGWHLQTASDINSRGCIIGTGKINGQLHGFLLRSTNSPNN